MKGRPESRNRITESLQLEETLQSHLVQLPNNEQGHKLYLHVTKKADFTFTL